MRSRRRFQCGKIKNNDKCVTDYEDYQRPSTRHSLMAIFRKQTSEITVFDEKRAKFSKMNEENGNTMKNIYKNDLF